MNQPPFPRPVLGFCAYGSGSGKTTLLTSLIPVLMKRGLRISVIKHAHHKFDVDKPGKDSFRLREAGAIQTLVASDLRWALMTERQRMPQEQANSVSLDELLPHLDPDAIDIVLVEGFKQANISKIEIHRPSLNYPLLAPTDHNIIAVATDAALPQLTIPALDLNDAESIADFIVEWMKATSHYDKTFA
ncbi:molybdopterin guanine dinucleotide biosynthesis accessory protein MobB [Methylobacillus rhizosphaerae]|uniref:Molybdopterin guanine dinucleotide biosynthesis accessory protein MobB n=1 Tax=Methylobacillus rhizosphaerae TaxID=551994 RepID=A0A238XYE0_9PROT|nr:molybdopterin-guanine dinucleotide biosynthesis protein B [Methylobacillus rhizosphaerae]SNR63541.1 molybdopterin guanine dinucleotide biosynthesis accessory protein MobB [Methylobacillus rhizosphaerae]